MPNPLDLDRLSAANVARRELKEKASAGPWTAHVERWAVASPEGYWVADCGDSPEDELEANAAFIAAARSDPVEADVDALIEEVRRLREENAELIADRAERENLERKSTFP